MRDGDATYDGLPLPSPDATRHEGAGRVSVGGADSYAEENYFSGLGLVERGMAMLLLDTPGRGSAIYLNGIATRYDYEIPVRTALDWLSEQPEIDADRIALVGISLGGYYAPRAAAFDERVKALVCWSGIMSLLPDIYDHFPPIQPQLRWITGTHDDATARQALQAFDLQEVASKITCPAFVTHGLDDRIMNVGGARRFFAALGSRDKTLRVYDGPGAMHCNYDDWRHAAAEMFDWLADRLRK